MVVTSLSGEPPVLADWELSQFSPWKPCIPGGPSVLSKPACLVTLILSSEVDGSGPPVLASAKESHERGSDFVPGATKSRLYDKPNYVPVTCDIIVLTKCLVN